MYITDMYRKRSVEIKYVIGVLRNKNKNMVVNAFPAGGGEAYITKRKVNDKFKII